MQLRLAASHCDQGHIPAEPGHVPPPVVEDEEEPAGESRRPGRGKQVGVQLAGPQLHVGRAESVEARGRGGDDVADAFVGGGGQQAGLGEERRQFGPAAVGETAQLGVATGGDAEPSVAQALRRVRQDLDLTERQTSSGQAESGEVTVVGGVQAQRPGARVATVPYARFARFGRRGRGGRHGGEHTDGEPADHRV